jgi:hypothetical protein
MEMPLTVTILFVPTFLFAKVALVKFVVKVSPATRLSESATLAVDVASYVLSDAVAVTVKDL